MRNVVAIFKKISEVFAGKWHHRVYNCSGFLTRTTCARSQVYLAQSLYKAGMYPEATRAAVRVDSPQYQQRMIALQVRHHHSCYKPKTFTRFIQKTRMSVCLSATICHHGFATQSVSTPSCRMDREGGWHITSKTPGLVPRRAGAVAC